MTCKCYHLRTRYDGTLVSECWGTREKDQCSCGGYEERCTFYPEKKEKALKNKIYEELLLRLLTK